MTGLPADIISSIQRSLEEDIGSGDATTNSIVPADATLRGQIVAKQEGVIAGLEIAAAVFHELDRTIEFETSISDGTKVGNRTVVANLHGSARALLTGERTALNFLGR